MVGVLKESGDGGGKGERGNKGRENEVAAFKRADTSKSKTCQGAVNFLMRHSIFGNAAGAPFRFENHGPSTRVRVLLLDLQHRLYAVIPCIYSVCRPVNGVQCASAFEHILLDVRVPLRL